MSTQSVVFLILSLIINTHAFSKSVNLSNSQLGGEGIALQIRATHVNTSNNVLHINPRTQRDTDLELILDQQWGFHPQVPSTIHITIDGFTPNITKEDGEFLMLFAVDNHQYFSAVIRLEDKSAWQSYPSYEQQPLATSNDIFRNIIVPLDPNRWIRLSNNDQFEPIGPGQYYKKALQWPLHITITNDPIQNTTTYQCTDCVLPPGRILTVTYTSSFATAKGMKVYIMNDASDGKPFDIYSIGVTYQYETETPTKTPTIAPSIPTSSPSTAPTTPVPTKAPSTPSPIIVIPPSSSTTAHPSINEMEQIDTTQSSHSTLQTVHTGEFSTKSDDKLVTYLIIGIIVIFVCFVVSCVGAGVIYKHKKRQINTNDTQYHHPQDTYAMDYNNDTQSALNMMPSQSSAANVMHPSPNKFSSNVFKHSIEEFNDALGNIVAGDQAIMDDVCHQIATQGGDDDDDVDDEPEEEDDQNGEYQKLNEYGEGRGFHHQRTVSIGMEGLGQETIVAMSYDEKINSLNSERAHNIMLNVHTAGGDLIIDDDFETIGADQPQ
eukprot:724677_1